MTETLSEKLRMYLGWCPNTHNLNTYTPCRRLGTEQTDPSDSEPPGAGVSPVRLTTPHWMDAVAVAILFATFFVGGNLWWVAFVLAVLVVFVIIRIRTIQTRRGA